MLEQILEVASQSDYDFRVTANPSDPEKRLFGQWVDYYRLKWAIAKVLQPASILEIGVRYGYSAAAFLEASPQSKYLGIDLDVDSFGGVKGAINWAREITSSFQAEFIVADSQKMSRFPGGRYDLVHVDGQQDGDGSWHDLQLATMQARWILVDGYFWTSQNFLAVSHFLLHYRDAIRFYGVIPGYAGELLVQVAPEYVRDCGNVASALTSGFLREARTTSQVRPESDKPESYKNGSHHLESEPLQVIATVANAKQPKRLLDLGCRGGLAQFFAAQGTRVTVVDHSQARNPLTEQTVVCAPELREPVHLVCTDLSTIPRKEIFDVVTSSDVIERLSPEELEVLYARVAQHLSPDGVFVLHTYPNLWLFQYDYVRKRRIAESVGAYLPPEPRTRYELTMHINEQSPRVLKRSLQRHFENVVLWFGEPGKPLRSLLKKMSHRELAAARDLYVVASHSPIDVQHLRELFSSPPIPADHLRGIELKICYVPAAVEPGELFSPLLEIFNRSRATLKSGQPNPVHISYHWLGSDTHETVVFDGERTGIQPPLAPGQRRRFPVRVQAPTRIGGLVLRLTLVQEAVQWFDAPPINVAIDARVAVGSRQPSEATLVSRP